MGQLPKRFSSQSKQRELLNLIIFRPHLFLCCVQDFLSRNEPVKPSSSLMQSTACISFLGVTVICEEDKPNWVYN